MLSVSTQSSEKNPQRCGGPTEWFWVEKLKGWLTILLLARRTSHSGPGKSLNNSANSSNSFGWKNCLISKGTPAEIAKRAWEFGKMFGVSFKGLEGEVVNRLQK